jgi:DNA-binding IclR family transcriptional regulator
MVRCMAYHENSVVQLRKRYGTMVQSAGQQLRKKFPLCGNACSEVPMCGVPKPRDRSRAKSVKRALAVLQVLADEQSGLGIVEISERTSIPVSSVHRLLSTLADQGFVAQFLTSGRYHIGFRAFEVGSAFMRQVQLSEIARPHLHELVSLTKETANLAICDGDFAIYVDQVQSGRTLQVVPRPGARVPLHCSAVGKVFLAGMPDPSFERTVESLELPQWTLHTITEHAELRSAIDMVRSQGYALDDEEMQTGVRCVASPIFNHLGETSAALSITGPTVHVNDETVPALTRQLQRIAGVISAQLGYDSES